MGTWNVGPFDNDTAADFSDELDGMPLEKRPTAIRTALIDAIEETAYLDAFEGTRAVAAAALIASQCPGGESLDGSYTPDEPIPELSADLRPLALKALDRVTAAESELHELWDEVGAEEWLADVDRLREVLAS